MTIFEEPRSESLRQIRLAIFSIPTVKISLYIVLDINAIFATFFQRILEEYSGYSVEFLRKRARIDSGKRLCFFFVAIHNTTASHHIYSLKFREKNKTGAPEENVLQFETFTAFARL